jgi:hypothetical protein
MEAASTAMPNLDHVHVVPRDCFDRLVILLMIPTPCLDNLPNQARAELIQSETRLVRTPQWHTSLAS